ncbi:hypothetical protein N0V92_006230 [Colletotrichum tropicale]|nr:hypothetical protein N0V92_006230 [Colletotrichum tropicale]
MDENGVHTKTEVDIKSKRISQVMQEINPDVENISLIKNPPVVPLELFYHNRLALQEELDKARSAEPRDEELISDLAEAVKFAEDDHAPNIANLEPLFAAGEITWDLLWAIFPPNILVHRYHRFTEQDQVLKLRAISQHKRRDKSRFWQLACHIVADDGIKFGLASEPMYTVIEEFTGARKIADLRVFPLKYHEKASEIRAQAVSRGKQIAEFQSLTEEQLIICTPVMLGVCFGTSKWGAFAMSRLADVKWNHQAFEDLVLEKPTKMLVRSMVK